MKNVIHLYYRDTNWQKRGYARNYNLIIDYDKKEYRTYENPFYGYGRYEDIEVKKKKSITDYEKRLKEIGFKKTF